VRFADRPAVVRFLSARLAVPVYGPFFRFSLRVTFAAVCLAFILWQILDLTAELSDWMDWKNPIIYYALSTFKESADTSFFYTISGRLKYASSIDLDTPTLFEGAKSVYPSPDNRKTLIVKG
jgi:hypothetical protein